MLCAKPNAYGRGEGPSCIILFTTALYPSDFKLLLLPVSICTRNIMDQHPHAPTGHVSSSSLPRAPQEWNSFGDECSQSRRNCCVVGVRRGRATWIPRWSPASSKCSQSIPRFCGRRGTRIPLGSTPHFSAMMSSARQRRSDGMRLAGSPRLLLQPLVLIARLMAPPPNVVCA